LEPATAFIIEMSSLLDGGGRDILQNVVIYSVAVAQKTFIFFNNHKGLKSYSVIFVYNFAFMCTLYCLLHLAILLWGTVKNTAAADRD
jgi:hypothetical protein